MSEESEAAQKEVELNDLVRVSPAVAEFVIEPTASGNSEYTKCRKERSEEGLGERDGGGASRSGL